MYVFKKDSKTNAECIRRLTTSKLTKTHIELWVVKGYCYEAMGHSQTQSKILKFSFHPIFFGNSSSSLDSGSSPRLKPQQKPT
jgi:hypothetical protein